MGSQLHLFWIECCHLIVMPLGTGANQTWRPGCLNQGVINFLPVKNAPRITYLCTYLTIREKM